LASLAAPLAATAEDKPAADIAGTWQGTLDVTVVKLRLVVDFKKKDGGGYTATMDSPDQNAFDIPIDEVTVADKTVKFTIKGLGGAYEGKLADDGKQIEGKWSQGGLSLALNLKPGEKVAPPKRPQEPKPPFPYNAEEVIYENKEAGIKIAGTLTTPKEGGPFPAVLLITGSGPQDRNEEIMGHKPFLLWADYLTRRGIAVLRVDDRGVGGTTGKPGESTIEDHAGDALAGVVYLKSRSDIDPKQIGLMGHSEGGLVAPAAAVKSGDVSFIVLLAGTGVVGEEILYSQGKLIAKVAGASDEAAAKNEEMQRKIFTIVKETADPAAAALKFAALAVEIKASLTEEQKKALDASAGLIEAQTKMVLTPWFRHFLTYDPKSVLEEVKCPVLAICGEKDLQVDPKLNLPAIEAALKAAGNKDYTVKEIPGVNHLLQSSKTGAISEYQQIEETINPAALEIVSEWIAKRTMGK
jgi:pimeloyl-ACP methyl ester carboxylesterase